MYKLILQEPLHNSIVRNKILFIGNGTIYDVRTNYKLSLESMLLQINQKYGKELCYLNANYIKKLP